MVNRKVKIVVACGAAIAQSSMLQMMISSYLDKKKVEDHASITLDDTFAVPGIILRDNIGVNK
mgnify:CR=1 FL=1